jgi:hypothetical protein
MSLNDRTSAEVAKINFPFKNWKNVVEQPYEITANIPIKSEIGVIEGTAKTPVLKTPKPGISTRTPRITPKTPRITNPVF